MAADITAHALNDYGLIIDDDDYLTYSAQYKMIAENANDCWQGFINICSRLNGDVIKGQFANKVEEIARGYGTDPGQLLQEIAEALASDMDSYVSDINTADGILYP